MSKTRKRTRRLRLEMLDRRVVMDADGLELVPDLDTPDSTETSFELSEESELSCDDSNPTVESDEPISDIDPIDFLGIPGEDDYSEGPLIAICNMAPEMDPATLVQEVEGIVYIDTPSDDFPGLDSDGVICPPDAEFDLEATEEDPTEAVDENSEGSVDGELEDMEVVAYGVATEIEADIVLDDTVESIDSGSTDVEIEDIQEMNLEATSGPTRVPRSTTTREFDVNADGSVSPLDVLLVVNSMSRHQHMTMKNASSVNEELSANGRLDVNRDLTVSPFDALLVINEISRGKAKPKTTLAAETQDHSQADAGRLAWNPLNPTSDEALYVESSDGVKIPYITIEDDADSSTSPGGDASGNESEEQNGEAVDTGEWIAPTDNDEDENAVDGAWLESIDTLMTKWS